MPAAQNLDRGRCCDDLSITGGWLATVGSWGKARLMLLLVGVGGWFGWVVWVRVSVRVCVLCVMRVCGGVSGWLGGCGWVSEWVGAHGWVGVRA